MAPELLDPLCFDLEKICPTKASDCYALGMVIYEVLSGQIPFAPHITPVVIRKVLEREYPERPQGEDGKLFTEDIWRMLELCWKYQPKERATANAILSCLEGNTLPSQPPSPDVDRAEADTAYQSDDTESNQGSPTTAQGGGGFAVPPHDYSSGSASPIFPGLLVAQSRSGSPLFPPNYPHNEADPPTTQDDGQSFAPQPENPRRGWVRRLARGTRKMFKHVTGKLFRS